MDIENRLNTELLAPVPVLTAVLTLPQYKAKPVRREAKWFSDEDLIMKSVGREATWLTDEVTEETMKSKDQDLEFQKRTRSPDSAIVDWT